MGGGGGGNYGYDMMMPDMGGMGMDFMGPGGNMNFGGHPAHYRGRYNSQPRPTIEVRMYFVHCILQGLQGVGMFRHS